MNERINPLGLLDDVVEVLVALAAVDVLLEAVGVAAYDEERSFDVMRESACHVGAFLFLQNLRLDHRPYHQAENQRDRQEKYEDNQDSDCKLSAAVFEQVDLLCKLNEV